MAIGDYHNQQWWWTTPYTTITTTTTPARRDGVWAVYVDGKKRPAVLAVYDLEVDALRSVVDSGIGRVVFLKWGQMIGRAVNGDE